MKKLSFQWRITLIMALLVSATCLILSFVISNFAVIQIVQIGEYEIEVAPFDGQETALEFDVLQLFPEISEHLESSKNAFLSQSIPTVLVVVALTSISTYFLAGKMLSPLRRVTSKMGEIEAQNLSQPIEVPISDDELHQMVCSFNGMLARLDESFSIQRQFSANAAHELRTPLAVMQTKLDVLLKNKDIAKPDYEASIQMLREQTGKLTHLVSLLLEMTELQTVERSDRVSLHALVEEVFCDLAAIAEKKHIELQQTENDCELIGSDSLLYRAIYNLVENGIKFSDSYGIVAVDIKQNETNILISVSDTGKGIDPKAWNEIFTPFFQTNKTQNRLKEGVGLGLALTKEIAFIHEGSVSVACSSTEGTIIEFVLPKKNK